MKLGSPILRWLLSIWARVTVLPKDDALLNNLKGKTVCYVFPSDIRSKIAIVEQVCRKQGLPLPAAGINTKLLNETEAVFVLSRNTGSENNPAPERLKRLIEAVLAGDDDILIVPVSVFWGRGPTKTGGLLSSLFSDGGPRSSFLSRTLAILFNGKQALIQYSDPVSLKEFVSEQKSTAFQTRKLTRVLRLHLARTRLATIGPDQHSPKKFADELMQQKLVQQSIDREAKKKKITRKEAEKQARAYTREIAAVINIRAAILLERILSKLWNKLYDGIVLHHFERLEKLSREHQLVLVPSHQSHIDYLVLSYALFGKGLAPPHIAAGINLNIPIVGPWFRRCGAFFLRRTFKGNFLYAAVFEAYMGYLGRRGTTVEYFVEGGRSRTGRRLKAKPGLLAMSVRSYVRNPKRSVAFIPINFSYEKLIEGQTYVNELSGKPKKTESVLGVLRAAKALKDDFGQVHVNFGEPIYINDLLDAQKPDWRRERTAEKLEWLPNVVSTLGENIMSGINKATHVNPIGLLALAMLSSPKQAMGEADLVTQLDLYLKLIRETHYSNDISCTELSAEEIVAYGEKFGTIQRRKNELGDVLYVEGNEAILLAYFRNNIVHLFALPSFIACCFLSKPTQTRKHIIHWFKLVYPFLKSELSMHWTQRQIKLVADKTIDCLIEQGLIQEDGGKLELVGEKTQQIATLSKGVTLSLQRYYMTLAILKERGQGSLNRMGLEGLSVKLAERISLIYEMDSPEFFDKALFKGFIEQLFNHRIIWPDEQGQITYGKALETIIDDAGLVLSQQLRGGVNQLAKEPSRTV